MKNQDEVKNEDRNAPIKAYTAAELRDLYGVSRHTWGRWMRKHRDAVGPMDGRIYTNQQVRIIFEKLDPPPAK